MIELQAITRRYKELADSLFGRKSNTEKRALQNQERAARQVWYNHVEVSLPQVLILKFSPLSWFLTPPLAFPIYNYNRYNYPQAIAHLSSSVIHTAGSKCIQFHSRKLRSSPL